MRSRTHRPRAGFTLLELILALLVAVMLLAALYAAISTQANSIQANRQRIEQATLARSLINRIDGDVAGAVGLADSSRFRQQAQNASTGSAAGDSSGGSTTPAATTPASTGGSTTTPASGTTASTTGSSTGSTTGTATTTTTITVPLGVVGDAGTLNLYTSKVPAELYNPGPDGATPVVSDVRRITYWLVSGDGASGGLARSEIKAVTQDSGTGMMPDGVDEGQSVIAPEVRTLAFRYWDGGDWVTEWDSTTMGDDGVTPHGSPRAIEITLGTAKPRRPGQKNEEVQTFRHVVFVRTANGTTAQPAQTGTPGTTGGGN
jgi:prepilin-type N-terminal cleavage/methylation domain-containing protein